MKHLARCLAPGKHSTNGSFLFLPLPLCFLINRSADTEPGDILVADLHSQQSFPPYRKLWTTCPCLGHNVNSNSRSQTTSSKALQPRCGAVPHSVAATLRARAHLLHLIPCFRPDSRIMTTACNFPTFLPNKCLLSLPLL